MIGAFLTMASLMQAQFVGGGSDENLRDSKAGSDSPWRNRFYLFGGPSMPIGAWGKEVDSEATLSAMYSNNAGFGAQRGWYAEMGSMFYLKKLALPEKMGIAINLTYFQIAVNKYTPFTAPLSSSRLTLYDFFFVNSKLGATYTYSLFANVCAVVPVRAKRARPVITNNLRIICFFYKVNPKRICILLARNLVVVVS